MRLIDGVKLIDILTKKYEKDEITYSELRDMIDTIKSMDSIRVVRCENCKKLETTMWVDLTGKRHIRYICQKFDNETRLKHFCSAGAEDEDSDTDGDRETL